MENNELSTMHLYFYCMSSTVSLCVCTEGILQLFGVFAKKYELTHGFKVSDSAKILMLLDTYCI